MDIELSEKEQKLTAELEQAEAALKQIQSDTADVAKQYHALQERKATVQALEQVAKQYEQLAGLKPLTEVDPLSGETLSGAQAAQGYTAAVERINQQIADYQASYNTVSEQYEKDQQAVAQIQKQVDKLAAELEKARPITRAKKIVRTDEHGKQTTFVVMYRRDTVMPWGDAGPDEARFKRILVRVTTLILLMGLIMPFWPVPPPEVSQIAEIPETVAKLIEERKPPPPPPPPPPAEKKPDEKVTEKKKPRKKAPKPKTEKQRKAREKASRAGLLAFSDSFADLMDNSAEQKLGKLARVTSGGETARETQRNILTSGTAQGSGGIKTAGLSRDVAGSGLEGRGTSRVTGVIGGDDFGDADRPLSDSLKASRTDEEIQLIFDRNKSALYSIYQRALRKNPSLQGKVVLKFTIAPSGQVTMSKIESSDLGDPALERKLAARVKLFNFGPKDVDAITIVYPIDFLPA